VVHFNVELVSHTAQHSFFDPSINFHDIRKSSERSIYINEEAELFFTTVA
jgi:hypothetical protein